jgi:uncharacterized membrane protein YfcA
MTLGRLLTYLLFAVWAGGLINSWTEMTVDRRWPALLLPLALSVVVAVVIARMIWRDAARGVLRPDQERRER